MKKILVVSDNKRLVEFFQMECLNQNICNIDYRYSITNKNPSEMISIGLKPINMKCSESIAEIINNYELIFSLHCKQIFPIELVEFIRCINIHPGLNPYNRGWYPQVFSIINEKPIGATIHLMDKYVDNGNIIDQISIKTKLSDTSFDIYERVFQAETDLIKKNILNIVNNNFTCKEPSFTGNYNSIQDFKALCCLNLDSIGTLKEHINLLRALSHGSFKNAYFINENGNKTFVKITLEEEN